MACDVNLRNLIIQQAQAQGLDPNLALRVASAESGICQWTPNGNVVTSSAGARGVFQLLPSSFPGQNIDDLQTNISLGVAYLKQLFGKYGDWSTALAAYNFGPGNVDSGRSWPAETVAYIKRILGGSVSTSTPSYSGGVTATDLL